MKLLAVCAGVEAVTGAILTYAPNFVVRLLLGTNLSAPGEALGHLAGFAFFSFGIVCWPTADSPGTNRAAARGLLLYNVLAAIFLIYLGLERTFSGPLLWPAAALHSILSILLARVVVKDFAIK